MVGQCGNQWKKQGEQMKLSTPPRVRPLHSTPFRGLLQDTSGVVHGKSLFCCTAKKVILARNLYTASHGHQANLHIRRSR